MLHNIMFNESPNIIAWWLAMTSCKEYPFSIHIEILLMMTQINKVVILLLFSTVVREIEDLIHNWKVSFKVINKDCLYFINKIGIVVVIIRDETKRIMLNISIMVNKIYNKWVQCAVFFTPMITLDFILHKDVLIFSKIPKNNHFIYLQGFFLRTQKISLTFG